MCGHYGQTKWAATDQGNIRTHPFDKHKLKLHIMLLIEWLRSFSNMLLT